MKYSSINIEKDTLIRLKNGDEAAFDTIYWKYSAWVYNFAYSILHDKALSEDLTQTVFLKIWERHEWIDPDSGFESYLFTIARNLAYHESERRLLTESIIENLKNTLIESEELTEQQIHMESLRQYVSSLIDQLPEARKEIYKLSRISQLSNKEIAAKLSISEKTVETQIYRSMQFLKRKLSDDSAIILLFAILFNQ